MTWFFIIFGLLLGLPLVMTFIGLILPEELCVARAVVLKTDQKKIWRVLTDFSGHPGWRKELKKVRKVGGNAAHPIWREELEGGGHLDLETLRADAPNLLVRAVKGMHKGEEIEWSCHLSPEGEGTRVEICERALVKIPTVRVSARLSRQHQKSVRFMLKRISSRFDQSPPLLKARCPRESGERGEGR